MKIAATFLIVCTALLYCTPAFGGRRKDKGSGYLALDDKETTRIGLHAEGYRSFYLNYQLVSFERFRASYNTLNADHLSAPLGQLRPTDGWAWGGGLRLTQGGSGLYLTFLRSNTRATATATLTNGDRRELKVEMKPVIMNFDFVAGIGGRIRLGLGCGMEIQHATLYSGYRYANGPLSYGTDQSLNGIFRARGNTAITVAARMDIAIVRQLRLTARAEYVGAFAGKQKGGDGGDYELLPWRDEMYGQSASGGIHTDGFNHFYLPEDPRNANNDYVYYVGMGSSFAKFYRGWRVSTGITLDLFTRRIE